MADPSSSDLAAVRGSGTVGPRATPPPARAPGEGSPAGPTGRAPGYLPGLDGLRAISVLAVVAYHLGEISGGFLGVDVFFVISGFLITRLLLAEHERTGSVALGAFWRRRFRRLLPALLVVLVAVAIASKGWLPHWRIADIRNDALGALAYVANWRFVFSGQSYFSQGTAPSPLRHTWSLAIEEQFYVLWPLLVVGALALARRTGRLGRRHVGTLSLVGTVASGAWMAIASASGGDLSRIYYGTDTRAFALCAGAWLATWFDASLAAGSRAERRRRASRWASVATVGLVPLAAFFALGATDEPVFYQGGFQLMAVLAVVVVAGVATGEGTLARVLGSRPLCWLGRRSYGLYLWSWPTQVMASERFRLSGLELDAVVVGASTVLAALSFWLVEEPVRTRRRPVGLERWDRPIRSLRPRRQVPGFALSGLAVVVVVGVLVGTAVGAPPKPTYLDVTDDEVVDGALAPAASPAGDRTVLPTVAGGGADSGPPGPLSPTEDVTVASGAAVDPGSVFDRPLRIIVTGDSVGWSLAWGLGPTLDDGLELEDRAIIGCGVLPDRARYVVAGIGSENYSEACRQSGLAEEKGLASRPDAVLLWLGAWEVYDQELDGVAYEVGTAPYAELLEDRLQTRVDRYREAGAVTVMPVVPCFAPNAARLGDERHQQDRLDWVNDRVRAVAARNRGWVRLVDPGDLLCDGDGEALPVNPDGIPLREDGSHFEPPAAVWFWNSWLGGQIGAIFPASAGSETVGTTTPPP